jgi:hypothetical protein
VNVRRFLTAPLLASALAAVVAMPAVAAPAPLVAGGSFVRTIPFIDGTLYTFECHAVAPGAASTTVSACTMTDGLHTIAAPPATTLGQAAVTTETVATTPLSQWRVCWTASSTYGDGTSQSTSGCTTASSTAGAG